ncbi:MULTISPECIES: AzlC family ABC transporter permease [Candidatus Microthrix]|uniref:AzlC family protein n=1 Tax=Candidatus Neomicrothrix parvicella RN1 TaxID=1229780 RepID=R4Z3N5_9ACTN|nr:MULTISPECIES: AzlC family ABC transporter permease [Microthrix]MBP6136632.1 AzlC family ABC transporter permease [Candidatus Microthrix sp.]MBP7403473.1 AzlC family ABC transporter permease [Candidatus Microthrix sp.]MBP7853524.1 AzlC family ABC transporter permease [Candidatus Microthrix sp.]MBP7876828.1 AzlC family ABC transporter permease [Candidatus Microthrix sp.]MBP8957920.1 AzlC family ABC transporter permease [Candidatus Microthrix sp.]
MSTEAGASPLPPSPTRRAITGSVSLFVPAIPFAMVLGVAIGESSINNLVGWSSSWIIFGGASQLTLITILAAGGAPLSALGAALAVNSRHLMYSAAISSRFTDQPRWFRWLAPYVLIDQQFALTERLEYDADDWRRFYLTSGAVFWTFWQTTVALGILLGPLVPASWGLDFAVPLMFLGLVVVALNRMPAVVAAVSGGVAAWLFAGMPNNLGLLSGGVVGVVIGTLADRGDAGDGDKAAERVALEAAEDIADEFAHQEHPVDGAVGGSADRPSAGPPDGSPGGPPDGPAEGLEQ